MGGAGVKVKMDSTMKQCNSKPAAGKKRKKAIKKGRETPSLATVKYKIVAIKPTMEPSVEKPATPLASILLVHRLDDHQYSTSSNSSIENSKPCHKQQKFEESFSSSASTPSHDVSMESDVSSMSCGSIRSPKQKISSSANDQKSEKITSSTSRGSTKGAVDSPTKKVDFSITLETLRWENQLSDEEQEKARIEDYKIKRRQRYQEALALHRQELASRGTKRTLSIIKN